MIKRSTSLAQIIVAIMAASPYSIAKALPRVSPMPPPLARFTDCKQSEKDPDVTTCHLPFKEADKYLFSPVDGEKRMLHITWVLDKTYLRKEDQRLFTYYLVRQLAYSCKKRQSMVRDVQMERYVTSGPNNTKRGIGPGNLSWKPLGKAERDKKIDRECPAEVGFKKFGSFQISNTSRIRQGSTVNVEYKNEDDDSGVISVDCSRLLLGVDTKPDIPIKPNSVGYGVFREVCF